MRIIKEFFFKLYAKHEIDRALHVRISLREAPANMDELEKFLDNAEAIVA